MQNPTQEQGIKISTTKKKSDAEIFAEVCRMLKAELEIAESLLRQAVLEQEESVQIEGVHAVRVQSFAQPNYRSAVKSAGLSQEYLDTFVTHVEKSYSWKAIVEECSIPMDEFTKDVPASVQIRYSAWTKEQ